MEDDNKEKVLAAIEAKKAATNPQILEMQQTMQEQNTRLAAATKLIEDQNNEIKEMRAASVKVQSDKLTKEKDLKEAFGVKKTEAPKTPDDINSLSNTEMLEVIATAVEGSIEATKTEATTELDKNFKGLEDKFDSIVGHIMKSEADVALQQVRTVNKDFDKYEDDIRTVLKQHQEFSYQDAYDWIKMKEAKGKVASKHVDSEKPDKDLSAADEAVVRSKQQPASRKVSRRRSFMDTVYAAVDTVQARRGEN